MSDEKQKSTLGPWKPAAAFNPEMTFTSQDMRQLRAEWESEANRLGERASLAEAACAMLKEALLASVELLPYVDHGASWCHHRCRAGDCGCGVEKALRHASGAREQALATDAGAGLLTRLRVAEAKVAVVHALYCDWARGGTSDVNVSVMLAVGKATGGVS